YPGFSPLLSHLFLTLITDFPHPYLGFSPPLSRFFPILIPLFPTAMPQLDSAGCPGQQNWTEGQEGTLQCQAGGRPQPKVECSRDGNSIPAGTPRPADRAHAGTYRCRATNTLGTAERNVTVWVQCGCGVLGAGG
ncbi:ICAM1 protein, partial [Dryoscopus gambensis]|nr:ICAM1 protein [Dryoscopus gambensis]